MVVSSFSKLMAVFSTVFTSHRAAPTASVSVSSALMFQEVKRASCFCQRGEETLPESDVDGPVSPGVRR